MAIPFLLNGYFYLKFPSVRSFFSLNDQVNRDPISNEMLKMRQQLEFLQAELCARGGGVSFDELQVNSMFHVVNEPPNALLVDLLNTAWHFSPHFTFVLRDVIDLLVNFI